MSQQIEQDIRQFIHDNFMFREGLAEISARESLLEAGLIDSTGILELVGFLESHFGITVADADIVPANLDTMAAIADYVQRSRSGSIAA